MIPPLHDLVVFLITVCLVVASGFPGAHSWLYRNPPIFPVGSLLGLSAKPFAPATNLRSKAERGVSPLAPQERPSRFDFNCQRANFSCRRQCVSSKDSAIVQYSANCPYWNTYHGFTRHMSIKELPGLITKVPRGTYRHRKLKALQSASEKLYSTAKDNFAILAKPKIRGLSAAGDLPQMAVTVPPIQENRSIHCQDHPRIQKATGQWTGE